MEATEEEEETGLWFGRPCALPGAAERRRRRRRVVPRLRRGWCRRLRDETCVASRSLVSRCVFCAGDFPFSARGAFWGRSQYRATFRV